MKANRERIYHHFRKLERTYEAREGLDQGPTATNLVRANAKISADAIQKIHPEIKALDEFTKLEDYYKDLAEKAKTEESPIEEVVEEENDLDSKTKDELKAMLDEKSVEYSATATKADLIALLGE